MKKILVLLMMGILLTGCSINENTANTEEDKPEYTIDDLAFYSEINESGNRDLLMWIGMKESDMDFTDNDFNNYYNGFEVDYYHKEIKSESDMMQYDEVPEDRVDYLNYTGFRNSVSTVREITTTGYYPIDGKENSTPEDVIEKYNLDPETESIYTVKEDDENYTIVIYLNVDDSGKVERVVVPAGQVADSVDQVEGANAFIKFMISDNRVMNIQMYKRFL